MICKPCRDGDHAGCDEAAHGEPDPVTAGTGQWCDCQHMPREDAK